VAATANDREDRTVAAHRRVHCLPDAGVYNVMASKSSFSII
jgi:hypothetical protein